MILTCPDCATSYFVDDDRIPPQGRSVKCSTCGARWRATPAAEAEDDDFDFAPAPRPAPEPAEAEASPAPPAEPEPQPEAAADDAPAAVDDDLEFVAAPVRPAPRRAPPPKPKRKAPVAAMAAAVAVMVLVGAAILFRQPIVQAAPALGPAYAAVGLPVDRLGLVIEGVESKAVLAGGRPVLSVTGQIRNVRDQAAEAPPIRISLLDKDGKAVAGKIAQPLNGRIPPGARRYFAIEIPDPPSGSHELEVAFEAGAAPGPAGPARAGADPAAPPAVEPVEARPLPSGSPDALADHG